MAKKIIKAQMKQRLDTKANWAAQNPVLLAGELGIVSDDPNLYKVGDGTTAWNALPFRGFDGTLVHTTGDSETAAMSQKGVTKELAKLESELDINIANQKKEIADFKEVITDQVENYKPIVINGNVTNAADEEDITSENNLLKLKDRSALNGMGYVILRKNKTFAEQVTKENTIYEIRYDFDLDGAEVAIPRGCILKFDGGILTNGLIKGNDTIIHADETSQIFSLNAEVQGSWRNSEFSVCWYGAIPSASIRKDDVSENINKCVSLPFNTILFPAGYYYVANTIDVAQTGKFFKLRGVTDAVPTKDASLCAVLHTDQDLPIIKVEIPNVDKSSFAIRGGQLQVYKEGYTSAALMLSGKNQSKIWGAQIQTSICSCTYEDNYTNPSTNARGIHIVTADGGYVTFVQLSCSIYYFTIAIEADDRLGGWITNVIEDCKVVNCRQVAVANTHGMNRFMGLYQVAPTVLGNEHYPLIYSNGSYTAFQCTIVDLENTASSGYHGNTIGIELHPDNTNCIIGGSAAFLYPRYCIAFDRNFIESSALYDRRMPQRGNVGFNPLEETILAEGKNTEISVIATDCSIRFTEGFLNPYSAVKPQVLDDGPNAEVRVELTFKGYKRASLPMYPLMFCLEADDYSKCRFNKMSISLYDSSDNLIDTDTLDLTYNEDSSAIKRFFFTKWMNQLIATYRAVIVYSNPSHTVSGFALQLGSIYMKAHQRRRLEESEKIKRHGYTRPNYAYVGEFFFDQNLNKPIWAKNDTNGAIIWVDATGATV